MASVRRVLSIGASAPAVSIIRNRGSRKDVEETPNTPSVVAIQGEDNYALKLLGEVRGTVDGHRHATGKLHISELLTGCVRKVAIVERYNQQHLSKKVDPSLGLLFAQGTAIHDYVKCQFSSGFPDRLYGTWSCICGMMCTEPMTKTDIPLQYCSRCGLLPTIYNEMSLEDGEYDIVGSPDIVLFDRKRKFYYPIEVKSISHEGWRELLRPKPEHILQVCFYWKLLKDRGYRVPSQASILYVTKGFNYGKPYKEFVVQVEEHLHRLQPYLDEAKELKLARAGGPLPTRTKCASMDCRSAKECPSSVICFGVDQ